MAIIEVTIVPVGVPGSSLSEHVARVIQVLKASGLTHELTSMGTIIWGDLDEIWKVLRQMHEACFQGGVARVSTQIKIDDRRDRHASPEQKIRSVMEKLE